MEKEYPFLKRRLISTRRRGAAKHSHPHTCYRDLCRRNFCSYIQDHTASRPGSPQLISPWKRQISDGLQNSIWKSFKSVLPKACNNELHFLRFRVFMAASIKMAVFWIVAPRSLVEIYRRFRGACNLQHQDDDLWLWLWKKQETLKRR
jgi:hypothetical protein